MVKISREKQTFKDTLESMIQQTESNVSGVIVVWSSDQSSSDLECSKVIIYYWNGTSVQVNVKGDSPKAIVHDVFKKLVW